MKLLKLFPVALAAFALASCSTEDFESSKTQDLANKGDLRIVWDTVDGNEETRALSDNKFNGPFFEEGDQIFVYDNLMHSTDVYAFQKNAFYFDPQFEGDAPIIQGNEVAYAVYPGKYWDFTEEEEVVKAPKGYVLRTEVGTPTCVDIKIPHVLRYKEIAGQYGYEIPFFGAASYHGTPGAEGTYIQADNFRALTARLRIKLDNAFGNVSFLRLSNTAGKPLSGTLTAKLYTGDDRTKSMLQVVDKDYTVFPEIYIDLRNVPSNLSYVYIPVVCGPDYDNLLNGDTDGITLDYSSVRTEDDPTKIAATDWKPTGMKFPGEVFSPNSRHAGKHTFVLDDMNPKKISDLLAQYKESGKDITIDLTNKFSINKADPTVDNVVYLPQFTKEDMTVTINLVAPFTAFDNTANDPLVVKNVDDANPTNAKVILNTLLITPDADKLNLTIDAPGADVQVTGDFKNQKELKLLNADKVTIGDGKTATSFIGLTSINWGESGKGVKEIVIEKGANVKAQGGHVLLYKTINEKFTVNGTLDAAGKGISLNAEGSKTTDFVIGADGEVKATLVRATDSKALTNITINGKLTATDATAAIYSPQNVATDITISGEVTGNVLAQNVSTNVTVSGKGKITGNINAAEAGHEVKAGVITITSETNEAVTGDVSTMGNVVVATTKEAEAIKGTLYMKGANKTLYLTQGYVNKINVEVGNTGTWETNNVTIDLDGYTPTRAVLATSYTPGLAAFKELAIAANNSVKYTESIWDGNLITNTIYKAAKTKVTYAGTELTSQAIFTASQLATIGNTDAISLFNDFDLKDKNTWEGITLTSGLDCKKIVPGTTAGSIADEVRTVKNLNISKSGVKGFINTFSGTNGVTNLTIAGVKDTKTVTAETKGTAALIGTNSAACTINNVTVTGIAFGATGQFSEVGGIIGSNTAAVTLTDCTVSGSIQGFAGLGGLIGATTANVTATGCNASGISFKQTYDSGKSMDINYARVGGFVGTVNGSTASTITITSGTAPSALAAAATDLKSGKCFVSNESESTGNFYTYTASQNFIGFSGNKNTSTANKISDYAMINGTQYCNNAGFGTTDVDHLHGTTACKYLVTWPAKTINARMRK